MNADFRVTEIFTEPETNDVIALCYDVLYEETFEKFLGNPEEFDGKENASNLLSDSNYEIPEEIRADIEDIFGVREFNDENGYDDGYQFYDFGDDDFEEEEFAMATESFSLREALNKIDWDTDNKYDLLNLYEACNLSENEKRALANIVYDQNDPSVIYDTLNDRFLGKEIEMPERVKDGVIHEDVDNLSEEEIYDRVVNYLDNHPYDFDRDKLDVEDICDEIAANLFGVDYFNVDGKVSYTIFNAVNNYFEELDGLTKPIKEDVDTNLLDKYYHIVDYINKESNIGEYNIPTYDEVIYYVDDTISDQEYKTLVDTYLNAIKDIKVYEGMLELSDDHTMWRIDAPIDEVEYNDVVDRYTKKFEDENNVEIVALGRSGRHICVEATLENILRYNDLKDSMETTIDDMVSYINHNFTNESVDEFEFDDEFNAYYDGYTEEDKDENSAYNRLKNNVNESLSSRLVDFIKDYDFYHYSDTLEVGDTEEDAIKEMDRVLADTKSVKSLLDSLIKMSKEDNLDDEQKENIGELITDVKKLLGGSELKEGYEADTKTFSQWFDETQRYWDDEEFYPFDNYIKKFPNAEVLRNATAEDIRDNAHRFYHIYDVDSIDREKAFHFASEELGLDYDVFYDAWLRGSPIPGTNLDESK